LSLPVDPTNSAIYYYQYCSDEINWEISAKFESKKFTSQTANDGGDDPQAFEVGSNQTLCK
ncbi:MAG: hypothetical protein Q8Q15_01300, partial [bacterium]|nr:hypothetical protein [bacterium]